MADAEIEPAVEGAHWRKVVKSSGRERYFCLKCDPRSTADGYCDIGSLNRHLRSKHKKRAFNTSTKHRGRRGTTAGLQTRGKRAARASYGRRSTPARRTKERAGKAKDPPLLPGKRAGEDNDAFVANKRRAAKGAASTDGTPTRPAEDCKEFGGEILEDWDPDIKGPAALLPPDHYITIPVGGLNNILFKLEATASSSSQLLEAKWFQMTGQCEVEKCRAEECNIKGDGRCKGKSKAPISDSTAHGNAGCMDKLSRSSYAKFPVFSFNSLEKVVRNPPSNSRRGTCPCKESDHLPPDTEENGADMLQWALRPMEELKKGDGQVPLVDYSDDSDGLD